MATKPVDYREFVTIIPLPETFGMANYAVF